MVLKQTRYLYARETAHRLTTFHFLENKIEVIIIFEEINDAENIFTTTTMIINIDFFEDTRSIWMTSFTNNLREEREYVEKKSSYVNFLFVFAITRSFTLIERCA